MLPRRLSAGARARTRRSGCARRKSVLTRRRSSIFRKLRPDHHLPRCRRSWTACATCRAFPSCLCRPGTRPWRSRCRPARSRNGYPSPHPGRPRRATTSMGTSRAASTRCSCRASAGSTWTGWPASPSRHRWASCACGHAGSARPCARTIRTASLRRWPRPRSTLMTWPTTAWSTNCASRCWRPTSRWGSPTTRCATSHAPCGVAMP